MDVALHGYRVAQRYKHRLKSCIKRYQVIHNCFNRGNIRKKFRKLSTSFSFACYCFSFTSPILWQLSQRTTLCQKGTERGGALMTPGSAAAAAPISSMAVWHHSTKAAHRLAFSLSSQVLLDIAVIPSVLYVCWELPLPKQSKPLTDKNRRSHKSENKINIFFSFFYSFLYFSILIENEMKLVCYLL